MDKKKILELKDQRAKLIIDMRDMNKPDMSADELASYNKMDADFDAISATIAREEKLLEQASKFSADFDGREVEQKIEAATAGDKFSKLTVEQEADAMGAWLRFNRKSPNDDQRKYAQRLGLDFNTNAIEVKTFNTAEYGNVLKFAQSAIQGDKGNYLVPDTLMGAIEIARIEHGNVRQVAQVIRTDSGGDLSWPTVDDTSNVGVAAPENSERSTTDLTIGKKTWGAHTYTSNFIKVPFELLEDSAINLVQLIGEMMGERLAEIEGRKFTTGTGTNEPQGIVTGAAAGNTTQGGTAITLTELHNLAHEVGSYYRKRGSYMMNPSTVKYVMQLTDGTGQFLWQPSVQLGQPDRFRGYPVYENEEMATIASAAKAVIFGDLSAYKIRDVGSMRIQRVNERFADFGQIGFIAHIRVDGGILNAGQNPIKYMLQA